MTPKHAVCRCVWPAIESNATCGLPDMLCSAAGWQTIFCCLSRPAPRRSLQQQLAASPPAIKLRKQTACGSLTQRQSRLLGQRQSKRNSQTTQTARQTGWLAALTSQTQR